MNRERITKVNYLLTRTIICSGGGGGIHQVLLIKALQAI